MIMDRNNGEYVYSVRYVNEIYVHCCRFSDLGLLEQSIAELGIFSDYDGKLISLKDVRSFLLAKVGEEERDGARIFMDSIDNLRV